MSIVLKIVSSMNVGPDVHHLVSRLDSADLYSWSGRYLIESRDKRGHPCRPHIHAIIRLSPFRGDIDRREWFADLLWESLNGRSVKHKRRMISVPWYVDILPSDFDVRGWDEYCVKNGDRWYEIGAVDLLSPRA